MRLKAFFLPAVLAAAAVAAITLRAPRTNPEAPAPTPTATDPSPICPWREPQRDLERMFAGATNVTQESRIITAVMVPAQKRLGRLLNPDENPLRLYRAMGAEGVVGTILVTRVKGEHGGIELVIGVETNGTVRSVLVQSHREPQATAEVIASARWLEAFVGKTAQAPLRVGMDLPDVRSESRLSAEAIAEGVRSQLIVLGFAELPMEARELGRNIDVHAHH